MKTRMLSLITLFVLSISAIMAQNTIEAKFVVAGNCDMCKEQIEAAATSVDGVSSAEWNLEIKMLEVKYDSMMVSIHKVHKAIAKAGYDTKTHKATDRAYDKLPGCCTYNRIATEGELKNKKLLKIARFRAAGIQF